MNKHHDDHGEPILLFISDKMFSVSLTYELYYYNWVSVPKFIRKVEMFEPILEHNCSPHV